MTPSDETPNNIPSQDAPADQEARKSGELTWDYAFPLLTNPFVMLDMCKVLGISFFAVCTIILTIGAFQGGSNFMDMVHMIPVMALCVGIIAVILLFVMLVIYGNRFPARFTVNEKGATIEVTPTQKKVNTAVIIIGLLARRPGVAGSGFLAKSQECQFFGWVDVFRVELFPRRRVVVLRNSWRTVARLYCTADNYDFAARMATEGVQRTKRARQKNAASDKKFRSQLVRDILNRWLMLGVVSFILATASPLLDSVSPLFGIGAVILLGLVTGRQVRSFFGTVGLVVVAWTVLLMVGEGSQVHSYAGGYIKFSNFDTATRGDNLKLFIFSVIGMLGLTACSIRNIISGRRTT